MTVWLSQTHFKGARSVWVCYMPTLFPLRISYSVLWYLSPFPDFTQILPQLSPIQLHSLPPTSSPTTLSSMSVVYVGWLFLGMGPALEGGWHARYHSIEENSPAPRSSQTPTAASASCVLKGTSCLLPLLHDRYISLWVCLCICPVVSLKNKNNNNKNKQTHFFLSHPTTLAPTNLPPLCT